MAASPTWAKLLRTASHIASYSLVDKQECFAQIIEVGRSSDMDLPATTLNVISPSALAIGAATSSSPDFNNLSAISEPPRRVLVLDASAI